MFFVFKGKPIAQKRARSGIRGFYNPQSAEKALIQNEIVRQMPQIQQMEPLSELLEVKAWFHTSIPKSWSQKRKESVLGKYDKRRPDIDNYLKFYFDVMNSLVFKDDSQIVKLEAKKIYSNEPRTHIEVLVI